MAGKCSMKKLFPEPVNLSKPKAQDKRCLLKNADLFVSVSGCDDAPGTLERPLLTFEEARSRIRMMRKDGREGKITVAVMAGEYRMSGFKLGCEDKNTDWRAYGDGEVVVNGGVSLGSECVVPLTEEERARLHGDAPEKVIKYDLKKIGLTHDDWDDVYEIGGYSTGSHYDDYKPGVNCEVFANGKRLTLARYPNGGDCLKLAGVFDQGQPSQFPPQNFLGSYSPSRNPRPGMYAVDRETNERIMSWGSHEGIWMYGWLFFDWADGSTPISKFDTSIRAVYPAHVSHYAAREGGPFYFYNVFDELDAPDEYYIDRENGYLYIYSENENPCVEMSITKNSLIEINGADDVTFDGMTFKCTRANGIYAKCDGLTVENCDIHSVYKDGIFAEGYRLTVRCCEISHVGETGVIAVSGDFQNLIPCGSVIENNLIHNWAEVNVSGRAAVNIQAVGLVCAHNEMYDSPHTAIYYWGNDNIIEYNYIRDVVKLSSDAGAIYAGREWFHYGNIIRYNCLYNITGVDGQRPNGIYWDDTEAGQTAYGNLLINVCENAFLIGGGRYNTANGNMIVNAEGAPFCYDDRGRAGVLGTGWFRALQTPGEGYWNMLNRVDRKKGPFAEKYPVIKEMHDDFSRVDDPGFTANPTDSEIRNNIVINEKTDCGLGWIADSVYKFGKIEGNALYLTPEEAGLTGINEGDYTVYPESAAAKAVSDFEPLPLGLIGRTLERKR